MYPKTVIYKRHSVTDKYCTLCKSFLSGDGSIVSPYYCMCGTYEYDWGTNAYVLKPKESE